MLAGVLVGGLCALLAALLLWMRRCHAYWRSRGVTGPAPSIPFGNCADACLGRKTIYNEFADIYRKYKHEPYVGVYFLHTPMLQLHDLDIIREVFVKNFSDFNGRGMYSNPEYDPITGNLFIVSGQRWRHLRVKLSPAFSSGKIKYYFSRVQECALNMKRHVGEMAAAGGGGYQEDARELIARYSTDIITSLIFGLESNTMKQPDSELRVMGRRTFESSASQGLRFAMTFFAKDLMRRLGLGVLQGDVNDFYDRIVRETVSYREKNHVERADLLNLLIQLKNRGFVDPDNLSDDGCADAKTSSSEVQKLSIKQIIAQVFIFYIAGFETTSTTTSYLMYELSKNPDVHRKVTEEIDEVLEKTKDKITFEAVTSMPYVDQVISETLRLYPPVPFLTREAMRARPLPGSSLQLERGTILVIPVAALHRDPEHWPQPDTFQPDRFSEANRAHRHPMAYMPFGDGPRICIGMRLAQVQIKAALLALLSRYEVTRGPNTPPSITVEPRSILHAPKGGLPVTLTLRPQRSAPPASDLT